MLLHKKHEAPREPSLAAVTLEHAPKPKQKNANIGRVFGFRSLTPRQNTGIMLAWFPYFVLVFVHKIPRKCLHLPERAQNDLNVYSQTAHAWVLIPYAAPNKEQ